MASKANLVIDQGTTYSTTINLTDKNGDPLILSGYTAASLIKKWYTSQTSIPFNTSINATAGTITLELDANTCATLYPGRYVYDVDLIDSSNNVSRVVEGIITVTPSVTAGIYSTNNTWFSANGYTDG